MAAFLAVQAAIVGGVLGVLIGTGLQIIRKGRLVTEATEL